MYQDTPYKDYAQIQSALRKKTVILRIARGRYSILLQRFGQGRPSVIFTFLLQMILPISFIVGWFFYCREILVLFAIPIYLLLPFTLPLGQFLSGIMTAFGLFGLIWHWPSWSVAILLPALLSYFGGWIWQQNIQLLVCRQALNDREVFEELWTQGLIALQDKEGLYQYASSKGDSIS